MKNFIYFMLPLCLGLTGCHEENGLLFNEKARVLLTTDIGDYSYSFVWSDASTKRDTVYFPVRVMGGPSDKDRHVVFEQVSEYNVTYTKDKWGYVTDSVVTERADKAVAGRHYVAFDDPEYQKLSIIPAGKVSSRVGIILLRDASLATEKVRLRIRLKANDDFELGERKFLERTVAFSDMLERPSNWGSRLMDRILGTYSNAKHRLMMKVVGEGKKIDEEWIEEASKSPSFVTYWRMKFIEELEKYNSNQENIDKGLAPMREDANDPNSALVTFPSNV